MFVLIAVFLAALRYTNGRTLGPEFGVLMAALGLACFVATVGAALSILQPYIVRK